MENLFKYVSKASASFVFLVLVATLVVLYLNAKPAIEAYGLGFITDSRWGVEVKIAPDTSSADNAKTPVTIEPSAETGDAAVSEQQGNDDLDDLDDLSLDDELSADDEIPMDDDTDTGQAGLPDAAQSHIKTIYGAGVPVVGTILSTLIAMLFSIPIAMGIAIFLSEIANEKFAAPVGVAIELLAAIPSIIYGMWALFYFGPFIAHIVGGSSVSLLVAGLVLGVMVIPFMAALSRDAINTTPDVLKESAYAMGATKFEVIKDVIFPYAKAGIIGSIIVSLGRAMGETMAVAFVIGGVFKYANKLTDPTTAIPVVLANNFSESSGLSMNSLFYLALILFVVSFVVIFSAKHFFLRRSKL